MQTWSCHSSFKSCLCPSIAVMMKLRSLNWISRPFVSWALLATLVCSHCSPPCAQCSSLKNNTVPQRTMLLPPPLFSLSPRLPGLCTAVLSAGAAVVLSFASLPPLLSSSLSLPQQFQSPANVCSSLRFQCWQQFLWKAFPPSKAGLGSFLLRYLPVTHYCVPRV